MQVVSQRFPQNSIGAVGSAMFLRFINPAIVSPYEAGILDKKPPPRIERGLKLMSKVRHLSKCMCCSMIIQVVANHCCFSFFSHRYSRVLQIMFSLPRKSIWGHLMILWKTTLRQQGGSVCTKGGNSHCSPVNVYKVVSERKNIFLLDLLQKCKNRWGYK